MSSKRGLAAATPDTRRRVARKGGRSVPIDKRRAIGRKGGRARAGA